MGLLLPEDTATPQIFIANVYNTKHSFIDREGALRIQRTTIILSRDINVSGYSRDFLCLLVGLCVIDVLNLEAYYFPDIFSTTKSSTIYVS